MKKFNKNKLSKLIIKKIKKTLISKSKKTSNKLEKIKIKIQKISENMTRNLPDQTNEILDFFGKVITDWDSLIEIEKVPN